MTDTDLLSCSAEAQKSLGKKGGGEAAATCWLRERKRWGMLMSFDPARNALLLFYSVCVCASVQCSAARGGVNTDSQASASGQQNEQLCKMMLRTWRLSLPSPTITILWVNSSSSNEFANPLNISLALHISADRSQTSDVLCKK